MHVYRLQTAKNKKEWDSLSQPAFDGHGIRPYLAWRCQCFCDYILSAPKRRSLGPVQAQISLLYTREDLKAGAKPMNSDNNRTEYRYEFTL
jgi:hypothetical protein